jgi:hypothetical protein
MEAGTYLLANMMKARVNQLLLVQTERDVICLSKHHGKHVERDLEEGPVLIHGINLLLLALFDNLHEPLRDSDAWRPSFKHCHRAAMSQSSATCLCK